MAYTTLTLGLTLTIPTNGTTNWGATMRSTTWTKISNHQHKGAGDGQQMVTASYQDASVTSAKLANNIGLKQYDTPLVPPAAIQTINWNNGAIQFLDLETATADVLLTLTNPVKGGSYRLFVTQAAAPLGLTWPANVKWPGAQAPILSQLDNEIDQITLYYDGTNYYGDWNNTYA